MPRNTRLVWRVTRCFGKSRDALIIQRRIHNGANVLEMLVATAQVLCAERLDNVLKENIAVDPLLGLLDTRDALDSLGRTLLNEAIMVSRKKMTWSGG